MRRVLIDTSAIYAFVVEPDPHHRASVEFTQRLIAEHGVLVLPDFVFAETMTLLKSRFGPGIAITIGRELRRNPTYQWMDFGPDAEKETWSIFQRYHDKKWSYFDCALLAVARRLRIAEVFAFDVHFRQMPDITALP